MTDPIKALFQAGHGSSVSGYGAGERITLPPGVALIRKGAVEVRRPGEHGVLLNRLEAGEIFGMSTVCNPAPPDTELWAARPAEICFLPEEALLTVLGRDGALLRCYLAVTAQKISFLNQKVAAFSSPDAERKLLTYLRQSEVDGRVEIVSYTRLADMLGMGRASLYRAMASLEEAGQITRERKTILLHP